MKLRRQDIFLYLFSIYPLWGYLFRVTVNMHIDFIAGALGFALAIGIFVDSYRFKRRVKIPWHIISLFGFTAYLLTMELTVGHKPQYLGTTPFKYIYQNPHIAGLCWYFVVANTSFNIQFVHRLIKFLYFIIAVSVLATLIQTIDPLFFIYKHPDILHGLATKYKGRLYSIYTWSGMAGLGMSFLGSLSIVYGIGLMYKKKHNLMLAGGAIVSFLVLSRWVMLNYILIVFQKVFANRRFWQDLIKYLAFMIFLLGVGYLVLQAVGLSKGLEDRVADDSANTRLLAVEMFAAHFPRSPLTGTGGVMTYDLKRDINGRSAGIHVGWLSMLYYYGLAGSVLYISFFVLIMRRLRKIARQTNYWGSFFAFFGFILANFTLIEHDVMQHGLLLAMAVHRFFEEHYVQKKSKPSIHQDEQPEEPLALNPVGS